MKPELINFLAKLTALAEERSELLLIVGGYLRDRFLLQQEARDIDLLYSGDAIELAQALDPSRYHIECFRDFRTVKIHGLEFYEIEIASSRTESYPEPASYPQINLCQNPNCIDRIKADLPRRDFRINALVGSFHQQKLGDINPIFRDESLLVWDLVKAQKDIKQREISVFHDRSFIDDPTRVYRAVRFATKLGYQIEAHTSKLMLDICRSPLWKSALTKRKKRFEIEFELIMKLDQSDQALSMLKEFLPANENYLE